MKPQRQPAPQSQAPRAQAPQSAQKRLMGDDPLAADSILERFYKPAADAMSRDDALTPDALAMEDDHGATGVKKDKPTHYKVVCISLYNQDIQNLETMVAELKRRGHTKANKSQLIRAALAQVDLGKIPKGF